jgi:hypothetical protein
MSEIRRAAGFWQAIQFLKIRLLPPNFSLSQRTFANVPKPEESWRLHDHVILATFNLVDVGSRNGPDIVRLWFEFEAAFWVIARCR